MMAVKRQATTFLSRKKDTGERVHTLRKTGGFLKTPTPGGVPVITTSPGDRVTNLQDQQNMLVLHHGLQLQLNSVNTVTNGPKTFGRINEGFLTRKCTTVFYQVAKKSGRNNKVTVLPRWPEGRVSLYSQREAQSILMGTGAGGRKGVTLII